MEHHIFYDFCEKPMLFYHYNINIVVIVNQVGFLKEMPIFDTNCTSVDSSVEYVNNLLPLQLSSSPYREFVAHPNHRINNTIDCLFFLSETISKTLRKLSTEKWCLRYYMLYLLFGIKEQSIAWTTKYYSKENIINMEER